MKNNYIFKKEILLIFISIFYSCSQEFEKDSVRLVLTGSVHGQLDPCGWKKNPLGGLPRRYTKINEMRDNGESLIVLDAGDMFYSTNKINNNNIKSEKHRCATMLQAYNKIGYDGINIGNYELLTGIKYLIDLQNKYPSLSFLSANIKSKSTNEFIFNPYKIVKRGSLDIGVIGVTNMVPDTMNTIKVDDYIKAGNDQINKIKDQVDIVVMLVNSDRSTHNSLPDKFKNADYIFLSGSTNRTSSSTIQKNGGPFMYSNGKQGKHLTIIDLELNDSSSEIIDVSTFERKIKQLNNRLKRLQKKDPNKELEDIYANQEKILNMIKQYRKELVSADSSLNKAVNKTKFTSFALNRKIKDDPELLTLVNSAIETCNSLDLSKGKSNSNGVHSHSKHKSRKNKLSKPPKKIDK